MTHLLKMLVVPIAFVAAFMLFGAPSAPATAFFSDSGAACADTGGNCYGACNNGDSNGDGDFDGFMCLTGITAGVWAVRSAYVGAALIGMGGAVTAGSLLAAGALGAYSLIVGMVYCGED